MNKYKKLVLSIICDAIGCLSYFFPGLGELSDIVWAPISGWIMTKMYKGKVGKIAGVVAFVEEVLPGTDIMPTFTIMWFYTYFIEEKKKKQ
ncbi:hypothetical protein [Pseudotamlana carrageenivorans]|uniref:Uncharacterized protein n=1 Tax=Pseudotamlana carrageenivorans TaxID=2069432 RepID=A0A2I7SMI9_9FLAO|nr:hypothetical protein [Tamlana carrageenivorans]AUS07118.1 hypothetical protein C1A40_17505 [Tamlana carrageenivorans]